MVDSLPKTRTMNDNFAKIKVVGVGGGGCNAINRMIESNVQGIQFIAINTDYQVLERSKANEVLRIGEKVTRGLGAGMDRNKGASAASESKDEISDLIQGADMLFVTAGMGGGTGTGAAPIVAQIARDMGILTVGVVTRPFGFEGASRRANADAGLAELEQAVDALIVVPNDKLMEISNEDMSFEEAFSLADQVLKYGVAGISDLIAIPGLINLDLADIRRVMSNSGVCHMGIGRASGQDRAEIAIEQAIHSPLLDTTIDGARKVIINFTGDNIKLKEISFATTMVRDAVSQDADIIFGAVPNPNMTDEIMITVIASGFDKHPKQGFYQSNDSLNRNRNRDFNSFVTPSLREVNSNTQTQSPNTNFVDLAQPKSEAPAAQSSGLNVNTQHSAQRSNLLNSWQSNATAVTQRPSPKTDASNTNHSSKNQQKSSFLNWLSGESDEQFEE